MNHNRNKILISITIGALSLALIVAVAYQIKQNNQDKQYKAMTLTIIEAAKKCINEEVCQKDKIFIKTLYDNNYLTKMLNPKTNEYIDENSYVKVTDEDYNLIIVE